MLTFLYFALALFINAQGYGQYKTWNKFTEHYNKALSSRDAEKYIDGEDEVVDFNHLINEFALLRNKFHGLVKALDAKQFQINNIVKLRVAGLEDVGL